jgi:hypothetical protein
VGKGDSLRGRLEHLTVARSPFARSVEDKELRIIQNVLKVEPETAVMNLEKALSFNAVLRAWEIS